MSSHLRLQRSNHYLHSFVIYRKHKYLTSAVHITSLFNWTFGRKWSWILSYDGTMLTCLKSSRNYVKPFIGGQRAPALTDFLFPIVSQKKWGLWVHMVSHLPSSFVSFHYRSRSEFMCLAPVVVSRYVGVPVLSSNRGSCVERVSAFWRCEWITVAKVIYRHSILQDRLMDVWSYATTDTPGIIEVASWRNQLTLFQYILQVC